MIRGLKISKRGIYRDAVRSSKSHFVKCSGLRWLSLMVTTNLPWLKEGKYWALPVLTVLCASKRFYEKKGKKPKKITDWADQILIWISRKCAGLKRKIYLTGDGSFATLELFMRAQTLGIGMIARMKLNARLYELPPKKYPKSKRGPKPPVGKRLLCMKKRLTDGRVKWTRVIFSDWYGQTNKEMEITSGIGIWRKSNKALVKVKWVLIRDPEGKLDPVLLACTDWDLPAEKIVSYFVRRWRVEVTFAEVRRHLGIETQRQWSDLAIERSTPCLMALFSIVCLFGKQLNQQKEIQANACAWYKKTHITFSDVLAAVRLELLSKVKLLTSNNQPLVNSYSEKIRFLWQMLTQAVA